MNKRATKYNDFLAVIVLYNCRLNDSVAFQTLTACLEKAHANMSLFVYNNSRHTFTTFEDPSWEIISMNDPHNSGVSKAYNEGYNVAKKLKKKWLLLLDQDTAFPKEALEIYKSGTAASENKLLVPLLISNDRLVSPFKYKNGKGKMLKTLHSGTYSIQELMPMNSGMLIDINVFEECMGFHETFNLDYSDYAFINRFKKIEMNFEVLPIRCDHGFSAFQYTDLDSAISRFERYINATFLYQKLEDPDIHSNRILLSRALRLSYTYRTPVFFKKLVNSYFHRYEQI